MKRAAARMPGEVQNPSCRKIRKRSAQIGRRLHRDRGAVERRARSRDLPRLMSTKFGVIGKLVVKGPDGGIRTCNLIVMSGRISIAFVDFAAFSFGVDRVGRLLWRGEAGNSLPAQVPTCGGALQFLLQTRVAVDSLAIAHERAVSVQIQTIECLRGR